MTTSTTSDRTPIISKRLLQARNEAGLSQQSAGQQLSPPVSYISIGKWERGEKVPNVARLIQLADLYEVSIDWLCGRK